MFKIIRILLSRFHKADEITVLKAPFSLQNLGAPFYTIQLNEDAMKAITKGIEEAKTKNG